MTGFSEHLRLDIADSAGFEAPRDEALHIRIVHS
jgi:hypothetical protein